MPKYIAKQSIGHFRPGEEIEGLEVVDLQALLASGAIEEYTEPKQEQSDGSNGQLQQLAAEIADLKANNQLLSDDKVKADAEIADLKAQVAELDKQLKAATAKKPATKTADDAK
ncbi:Atg14 domain-containing protein [Acinetobacter sp. ANC5681]|uniref:Atg14 domain-containing protein n=1 Tax=Acinetobacter sp. ANC5681 TaxID=2929504 RepID=UPI00201A4BA5|nr:Atg14 domain-containing protein [Acinetobacter sp. ANC5681]MCL5769313.1 Atg14 domain-containing protein [Acinetobacter sp. ANC5681]